MNYTPYHYKFVLMKCVLLVPDKFVPEIHPKMPLKKFLAPDFSLKLLKNYKNWYIIKYVNKYLAKGEW